MIGGCEVFPASKQLNALAEILPPMQHNLVIDVLNTGILCNLLIESSSLVSCAISPSMSSSLAIYSSMSDRSIFSLPWNPSGHFSSVAFAVTTATVSCMAFFTRSIVLRTLTTPHHFSGFRWGGRLCRAPTGRSGPLPLCCEARFCVRHYRRCRSFLPSRPNWS